MKKIIRNHLAFLIVICSILFSCTQQKTKDNAKGHEYNSYYSGKNLDRIAFPVGGIGAGMFCLEGTGAAKW